MSQKSVKQESLTRASQKSVKQECLTRVSSKSVKPGCPARVSHKSVKYKTPLLSVSREIVLQECHVRLAYKSVKKASQARVSYKSVGVSHKSASDKKMCECLLETIYVIFKHIRTCRHSGSWVSSCFLFPSPFTRTFPKWIVCSKRQLIWNTAGKTIRCLLQCFWLHWAPLWYSKQIKTYRNSIKNIKRSCWTYFCICNRKTVNLKSTS